MILAYTHELSKNKTWTCCFIGRGKNASRYGNIDHAEELGKQTGMKGYFEVSEFKRIIRRDASDHCAILSVLKFKKINSVCKETS